MSNNQQSDEHKTRELYVELSWVVIERIKTYAHGNKCSFDEGLNSILMGRPWRYLDQEKS